MPNDGELTVNVALLEEILDIVEVGDRHGQTDWWATTAPFIRSRTVQIDVERIRAFAHQPQPVKIPALRPGEVPVCTSTACVAGWGAILSAPAGTMLTDLVGGHRWLLFPDGRTETISEYARQVMGLNAEIAMWLFRGDREYEEITGALRMLISRGDALTLDDILDVYPEPDDEAVESPLLYGTL